MDDRYWCPESLRKLFSLSPVSSGFEPLEITLARNVDRR